MIDLTTIGAIWRLAARYQQPFRVYLYPGLDQGLADELKIQLPDASFSSWQGHEQTPAAPGVVIFSDQSVQSQANAMAAALHAFKPGRGVMLAMEKNRDRLVWAINDGGVGRIVARPHRADVVADAILKVNEQVQSELSLQLAVDDLEQETETLQRLLDELRQTEDEVLRSERLQTVGRMTSALLSVLDVHLEKLDVFARAAQNYRETLDLGKLLDYAQQGTGAIRSLLCDLRAYASQSKPGEKLVEEQLDELIGRVAAFGKFDKLGKARRIHTELDSKAVVFVDRYRVHHAVLNLIRNACQATEPGDDIWVRTRVHDGAALIEVKDGGQGMSEDVRARLFEPFFSTKGAQGMGLGLRLCRTSIESCGGSIACQSELGSGTTFTVSLPLTVR